MRFLTQFLGSIILGLRCPVCLDRTYRMEAHMLLDHADDGADGWWRL